MVKSFSGKKSGNPPGTKIIVNSKAYGRHERAARGSKSKAGLNESMKNDGRRMIDSILPARLIQNALLPYRKNFKGGLFWQRLVSHFATQAKNNQDYNVLGMSNWDLNNAYPTSRILAPTIKVTAIPSKPVLNICIG